MTDKQGCVAHITIFRPFDIIRLDCAAERRAAPMEAHETVITAHGKKRDLAFHVLQIAPSVDGAPCQEGGRVTAAALQRLNGVDAALKDEDVHPRDVTSAEQTFRVGRPPVLKVREVIVIIDELTCSCQCIWVPVQDREDVNFIAEHRQRFLLYGPPAWNNKT